MSDSPQRPPYRPATDTPDDEPDPRRIGLIRHDPFEHFCAICGRWGAWGVGADIRSGDIGTWYCREHLPAEHQPPRRG